MRFFENNGDETMSEKIHAKDARAALKLIADYCKQQDGCQWCEFFNPYGVSDEACLFFHFDYPSEWQEYFDIRRP